MTRMALWKRVALYAGMGSAGLLLLLPFYYMIVTSLKTAAEAGALRASFRVHDPTLAAYRELFAGMPFILYFWNSMVVASITTVGTLFFCSLAGYAFAKHRFPGRDKIFMALLASMMIPGTVLLVPGFLLMRDFGWLDSFLPLTVPALAGAFGVFLARQFIQKIPDDLLDAARIDGCSEFRIYRSIVLPLCKPLLASLGILTFLWSWNRFLDALVYLYDEQLYTLPLGLSLLQGRYTFHENIQMAGAALAILPVLVVFFFLQKRIVKSLATTGLKG